MLPRDLKPELFRDYPSQAKKLAVEYLPALRELPISFVPSLLREVIDYDLKFPSERAAVERELENLKSLNAQQRQEWFGSFEKIEISSALEKSDWINSPAQFVEQLSAHLWTTHQLDAFRAAATRYAELLQQAMPPKKPAVARLGIAVVGQGVSTHEEPLFRKLRPHGAYFHHIRPENGLKSLLDAVSLRAKEHPGDYAHWYIDGGVAAEHDSALTTISYGALAPTRAVLLKKMRGEIERPGMGPETLRTVLAQMRAKDLGLPEGGDPVLDRFKIRLLTEGSGTQIFSTTFAQWAARECLRRAQPLTLLVRFAPRQRQKPMNELLATSSDQAELDPAGSLVDAEMGAYYNWLNQQRLPGAEESMFLVWFEGQNEAVAIGPGMARGTESASEANIGQVLAWMT